jgi:cation:H+ antiporter
MLFAGFILLVMGAEALVRGASSLAAATGVSPLVIGLTIVAAGTSLPELATSVVAGLRRQKDIAVGNIVGSNIFNILAVLGMAGIAKPGGIAVSPELLKVEIPIMIMAAVICLPIFYSKKIISRREGILLLSYYLAFTGYLVLDAMGHPILPLYIKIVAFFYCPATLLMLVARAGYDFYLGILKRLFQIRN